MIEIIGIGFMVALVWLLAYGMSATEAETPWLEETQSERASSSTKRAA